MFHLHPSAFGIGPEDPAEHRERSHRIALSEARFATRHRERSHNDLALADAQRTFGLRLAMARGLRAAL
jgi:hypothetical protein